jgi:hypothetical protein
LGETEEGRIEADLFALWATRAGREDSRSLRAGGPRSALL